MISEWPFWHGPATMPCSSHFIPSSSLCHVQREYKSLFLLCLSGCPSCVSCPRLPIFSPIVNSLPSILCFFFTFCSPGSILSLLGSPIFGTPELLFCFSPDLTYVFPIIPNLRLPSFRSLVRLCSALAVLNITRLLPPIVRLLISCSKCGHSEASTETHG